MSWDEQAMSRWLKDLVEAEQWLDQGDGGECPSDEELAGLISTTMARGAGAVGDDGARHLAHCESCRAIARDLILDGVDVFPPRPVMERPPSLSTWAQLMAWLRPSTLRPLSGLVTAGIVAVAVTGLAAPALFQLWLRPAPESSAPARHQAQPHIVAGAEESSALPAAAQPPAPGPEAAESLNLEDEAKGGRPAVRPVAEEQARALRRPSPAALGGRSKGETKRPEDAQARAEALEEMFVDAYAAYSAGRWRDAIGGFERILELEPGEDLSGLARRFHQRAWSALRGDCQPGFVRELVSHGPNKSIDRCVPE